MGIVLLTSIICTTIVYSAFNTEFQIKGAAALRVEDVIRITKLRISNQSSGVTETYNNKFGKDTTSMYVSLPSKGSITYEVEITNKSSIVYDVSSIKNLSNTNSNITVAVSLKVGDVISKNVIKKFTITLTNNTSVQQIGTVVYQYEFVEHINSYVVKNCDEARMYELSVPYTGEYKIELWGASGGKHYKNLSVTGGTGAYTAGNITLTKDTTLYIYVGGEGEDSSIIAPKGGYNGGGDALDVNNQCGGGGGATDVRLIGGNWDNFDSLKSRIMVAAGGGGSSYAQSGNSLFTGIGGNAGGLTGYRTTGPGSSAISSSGSGASITAGGNCVNGSRKKGIGGFGYGGAGGDDDGDQSAGGGSGYYGGGGSCYCAPGGGGSSYISGHNGCNSIASDATSTNLKHTSNANHYSGYKFSDTVMVDGTGCKWTNVKSSDCSGQTQPDGTNKLGHIGDGYARITFVKRVFD